MMQRSDRSGRASHLNSGRGRLDPLPHGDASKTGVAQGPSVASPDESSSETDLLTDAQLAVRWQLSRGTLANQRSQGRGPAYLKLAGRVRYRLSEVEAYEQAAFVSREPSGTRSLGNPIDVQDTLARPIRALGS